MSWRGVSCKGCVLEGVCLKGVSLGRDVSRGGRQFYEIQSAVK